MRARDIKPGFYKSEQLAECSMSARLLFPGLWMIADREGRLEYRPKRIKAEIFPYDSVDTSELISELERNGLVIRYTVSGCEYLFIPGFSKHQSPHVKEKPSEIPAYTGQAPGKHGASTVQAPDKHGANPASSLTPSSLPPEDKEANASLSSAEADDDSEAHGQKLPDCPHKKIIEIYHEVLPELPRVRMWNGRSEKSLAARWREKLVDLKSQGKPYGLEDGLEWWRKFFLLRVRPSPLLMGKIPRQDGSAWMASLRWLVLPENFAKTFEGSYLDRRAA